LEIKNADVIIKTAPKVLLIKVLKRLFLSIYVIESIRIFYNIRDINLPPLAVPKPLAAFINNKTKLKTVKK
jgi:hypothetical protein